MAENVKSMDRDAELRQEFGELVRACERCAREACRPWQLATALLTAALAVALWCK